MVLTKLTNFLSKYKTIISVLYLKMKTVYIRSLRYCLRNKKNIRNGTKVQYLTKKSWENLFLRFLLKIIHLLLIL